ncbi:MAG: hypothetical protein AVDCRST_MAG16-1899, partial [uncultured Frankineae bacterium]
DCATGRHRRRLLPSGRHLRRRGRAVVRTDRPTRGS